MKAIFGFTSLLIVVAIVAATARHQLRAVRPALPVPALPASEAASSAAGQASGAPDMARFQTELNQAMRLSAERAASAGGDGDAR